MNPLVSMNELEDLITLNRIATTLNQSVDVESALRDTLADLVDLMGLEAGWIFLKDPAKQNRWAGVGYHLVAHYNLPPGMQPDNPEAWEGGCDCQGLCNKDKLIAAYNEVRCSRLGSVTGDKQGLTVHASVPLKSAEKTLGILNVAGKNWDEFTPRALTLLTNVGSQMGIAIERAQLYDLLQEQLIHEQIVLLDLSNQLLGRPDLEDLMDYLVEEVQRLLKIDASALLLPQDDPEKLYFMSASGWNHDPVTSGRWLPADERSGPGLVMQTQTPLLVDDLTVSDPAPWMSDWLRVEDFRGHAVLPLIAEGRSVGALVVNSRQPRMLKESELRLLRLLGNQVAIALEKARLYQEDLKRQRMEEGLAISQRIQLSLLPQRSPTIPGWQFAAMYKAAELVGGDFYDFITLDNAPDVLGIVIADVADKGVPAALFMAVCRTIIRSVAISGRNPAAALERANQIMLNDSDSEVFLTAFYAKLDSKSGQIEYSNAGHNPPLCYRALEKRFDTFALKGMVLGIMRDIHLNEAQNTIEPGDVLILYTDGATEAMSVTQEEYGVERLKKVIADHAHLPAYQILRAVVDDVNVFTANTPQSDDFTMLVIKREH